MYIINLITIINSIPEILQYFIPGYLGVLLFEFINGSKISYSKQALFGVVFSVIAVAIIGLLPIKNTSIILLLSILLILAVSAIVSFVYRSEKYKEVLGNKLSLIPHDVVWDNTVDLKDGSLLRVYLKNQSYYIVGNYLQYDTTGGRYFLCLVRYRFKNKENGEPIFPHKNDFCYVLINMDDVERIEIENEKDEKLQKRK